MDAEYCNNSGTDVDLKETIQNAVFQMSPTKLQHAKNNVVIKAICSTLFKYGE
jgi:hypothetical protein